MKTDKKQHPTAQPEPGKVMVYVIGDTWDDHVAVHRNAAHAIRRRWHVGRRKRFRSYFFFPVVPGDHRLCTNMQSKLQRQVQSSTVARSFTAEAGQSYYFRTVTPIAGPSGGPTKIMPVDPAEAHVLIAAGLQHLRYEPMKSPGCGA